MSYQEFLRRALTIFVLGIFFLGLWELRNIFIVLFLASLIALVLSIPVSRLQALGLRRPVAVGITLLGAVGALIAFFAWILPTLVLETAELVEQTPDVVTDLSDDYTEWRADQSQTLRGVMPDLDLNRLERDLTEDGERPFDTADVTSAAVLLLGNAGAALLNFSTTLVFVVVVTMFLLLDPMDYIRGGLYLIPQRHHPRALEILLQLRLTLTTWMTALSISMSITALLVWLILGVIIGVENSLAIAVIAAVSTIIPNIGVLIPIVPIVIFMLSAGQVNRLPIALAAYVAIQQVEGNIITPVLVRRELRIPAALIFTFQLIAAFLFGAFGIVLAVPLLATIITLVRELYVYDTLGLRDVDIHLEREGMDRMTLVRQTENKVPFITTVTVTDVDGIKPVSFEDTLPGLSRRRQANEE